MIFRAVERSLAKATGTFKTASMLQLLALKVLGLHLHVSWRQKQDFCSVANTKKGLSSSWFVYGVILPIQVNKNYQVVKIGKSQKHRVAKRLYDIHNNFSHHYNGLSIFKRPPQQRAKTDTIIDRARKTGSDEELFLLSQIAGTENNSNFVEREARQALGVRQLNFDPAINVRASKETEWILVPRLVIRKVKEAQRNGEMDYFNNARDFIEKLRCYSNKCYTNVEVVIGETRMSMCVPEHTERT